MKSVKYATESGSRLKGNTLLRTRRYIFYASISTFEFVGPKEGFSLLKLWEAIVDI